MADTSEIFVVTPADGDRAWLLMYEYSEGEEYFAFSDLERAQAHAAALAGESLQWRPIDAGGFTATSER
ncbi:MAG: hypothetical protein K0U64_11300 [Actinomycetia bacterium]|nr:hypothetical protein [Actinomycetes bacterium]